MPVIWYDLRKNLMNRFSREKFEKGYFGPNILHLSHVGLPHSFFKCLSTAHFMQNIRKKQTDRQAEIAEFKGSSGRAGRAGGSIKILQDNV